MCVLLVFKPKNRNHLIKKVTNKGGDKYINNFTQNSVSAVFHSRVIRSGVLPRFIELCMETPCLCPSEGHKHGRRKVTVLGKGSVYCCPENKQLNAFYKT